MCSTTPGVLQPTDWLQSLGKNIDKIYAVVCPEARHARHYVTRARTFILPGVQPAKCVSEPPIRNKTPHYMTPEVESAGIAATLGLDYKLFLAQLINFGLIVLVIWKFVYGPLAKAMDERTAKIDKGLKDAKEAKAMVENAESEREKLITESRLKAKEIIESAEADAKKRRDEMVTGAKSEVERVVTEGKQRLRDEQAAMVESARQQVAELVLVATEKVTGEKMDEKKDAALVKKALEGPHV